MIQCKHNIEQDMGNNLEQKYVELDMKTIFPAVIIVRLTGQIFNLNILFLLTQNGERPL